MKAIVGQNCDLALFHAEVDDGEPLGLIAEAQPKYGPPVAVHWEVYSQATGEISEVRHLWVTVMIADDLVNPNGSRHEQTGTETYGKLVEIVTKNRGIGLITRLGAMTGLKSSGHVMIQRIFPGLQTIEIHLTTRLTNFAPVDPTRYVESRWVDEDAYQGGMHWGNSYWRT
jgi:hypothetical protein